MQTNRYYYEYSIEHPEPFFDPYYEKNMVVLPLRANLKNELTTNNERLIDLVTAFQVAINLGENQKSRHIQKIIEEIINILDCTKNINLTPFCQFFMVQNSSYAIYQTLPKSEKMIFLYEMLGKYCKERHAMYKSHGYSNMALQVVCDSYSHKRNSKTSIIKFVDLLRPYTTCHLQNPDKITSDDNYYFLPDKSDKECFERLLKELDIVMESREIEQGKLPDIVFKRGEDYYIFELKMMKGSGGGQNKQAMEFAYFISFSEKNPKVHYGVLLDSLYSNELFTSNQPKIANQRRDVLAALKQNPQNFFVNTAGAVKLLADIFANPKTML